MISKGIQKKGILSKLLEQALRILLKKECKNISKLEIDIISSSSQVIKGEIQKININAEDINYKDLLLDKIEIKADHIKVNFKFKNKELYFKNNPIIEFKISLSGNSLKKILSSDNWKWIENMISEEVLNQNKIKDISIYDNKLLIKSTKKDNIINNIEQININTAKGKIFLENIKIKSSFHIPIEDKIYIKNVFIENNLIHIFANSSVSF